MAMNPASIMKIMGIKNKFEKGHPKFVAFFRAVMGRGIHEGTIIEIKITDTDGTEMVGNMRVTAEDLQIIEDIKTLQS